MLKNMSKKILVPIIILSVLSILSMWIFFTDSSGKVKVEVNSDNKSTEKVIENEKVKVSDLIIIETNEEKKIWEIVAESGTYDKAMDKATLNNIKGNFYKNDEVVLSVEAPLAIYDSANKEVTLKNGATAANNKNVRVTANEINWAGQNKIITATGNVKINQDDKMLTTSDKSVFNTDFTYLKLSGNSNSYVFR